MKSQFFFSGSFLCFVIDDRHADVLRGGVITFYLAATDYVFTCFQSDVMCDMLRRNFCPRAGFDRTVLKANQERRLLSYIASSAFLLILVCPEFTFVNPPRRTAAGDRMHIHIAKRKRHAFRVREHSRVIVHFLLAVLALNYPSSRCSASPAISPSLVVI